MFRCFMAEKIRELEPCLSSKDCKSSENSGLYQSIDHKSRNHLDWFDKNLDTLRNLLKDMQKVNWATSDNLSSANTRQQRQAVKRKVQ